uniref:Poly(ADP-ribose) polymerase family member 4 n=1 Tax=Nomascus leucogenys TaxID=61853 RepID=G1RT04_NOMLE
MMMGIFANCIFCLKVKYLPRQQKKKLQTDIKENGGKFSFSLNPQCTHIILDNADVLSQYQLNSIQKNHVHIANPDFIWESIRENRLLDVKNYDPYKPLDITPPPDQKASSPEVKTEDLCPDNATEEEDTVELTEFGTEHVEIPHLPQDFEVAKYNTLEKVGMEGGQEAVVVELQCSQDSRDCPFLISSHFLLDDGIQTRRQFAIKKTSEDASEYYENYIEELKKQGFLLREHFTPEATQLASEQLQALLLEEVMNSSTLSQEVSDLVEMIWAEALGHLEHTLLKPVKRISLNDVSKAEGILLLVKAALKNGETAEQLQKMMTEFYRLIPHKGTMPKEVNLGLLAKKADLCQLIRDMVNVCETNLSKPNPPSLAKYRALRCKIEHVEQNTEEFLRVRKEVLQNHHSLGNMAKPHLYKKIPENYSSKAGLQDASGNLVPLEDVHIKGRIIDTVAQHIVGEVRREDIKEKEEAQREYREAVTQGHGAYLMSQDAPDVFTVSVGNLPPKAKVLIKITYITELSILGTVGVFFMPATVAPWQQDKALNENLQDTVEKICIKEIGTKQSFSLSMSIEMPYVIEFIFSDTHELKQKHTDCKAVISTMEGSSLDSTGFSLHVGLSAAYLPRMWVEKHPEKESEACMLVFQPDLDVDLPDLANESEVIICLDCSSSMEGVTFLQAKQIALHALSLVGEKQKVNVIQFGTGYKELFSYPKHITSNTAATEFIMSATPTMGNTDFWKTLRYLSLLYPAQGSRNILLVSDGHLQDESLTLQLVKRSRPHTRLFACGIGSTANRHILRILSQCGAGVFEYFNAKSKHSWRKQVEDQMTRLCSPSCHSVSVKWQQLNPDAPEALQAPAQVPSLFLNDRLLVYGFIPHCTQATLCALIQEKEFCTMVSTTELQKTTGTMIHKLAARALIRDYEDGILHENETSHEMKKQTLKSLIIKLSKENSLITQFTSFVAVEKRDKNESPFPNIPKVSELIAKEDVDFLPYMSWQGEPQEAVRNQPLLASSEWQELRSSKPKLRAKRKKKLSQPEVSEDFEEDGLGVLPAFTSNLERGGVEKLLDLSWTESCKPTATESLFKKVSPQKTSTSSFFPILPPAAGACLPPTARAHGPVSLPFASYGQIASFGSAAPPRQFDASQFSQGPAPGSCADWIPQLASYPTGPPQNLPFPPCCGGVFSGSSLSSARSAPLQPPGGRTTRPSAGTFPELDSPQLHFSLPTDPDPIRGFGSYHPSASSPFHFQPSTASLTVNLGLPIASALPEPLYSQSQTTPVDLCLLEESVGSLEGSQCPDFGFQSCSETESDELSEVLQDSCFLQIKYDTKDDSILRFLEVIEEDEIVCTQHWQDAVPWTELFSLQTEDGFWKLTPELGLILNLNTNGLHSFLKQKGIQSLGVKGRERLLDLIATMLVLQFIRTRLEKEGIVFKSLMKMDDSSISRWNIPWAFEAIKQASEWVRRTEGQYPSICPRLELGKDWDSATKQLLGLQPINTVSPLHRVLHYSQG